MTQPLVSLEAFLKDEEGAVHGAIGYMAATLIVSVPLGLMFLSIYEALCSAGRYSNFILGLF